MTPEYRIEIEERIKEYFKSFDDIGQIINIKCEETFSDLGYDVNVWNVKTKTDSYWVVEGENAPMNLYTQNGHYFSADEAYSFHMGITQRLTKRHNDNFKHIIDELPLDIEISTPPLNKLSICTSNCSAINSVLICSAMAGIKEGLPGSIFFVANVPIILFFKSVMTVMHDIGSL
mgnify:CR=1 FL=1